MLAYHVEWHMRQCLKPMLFDEEEIEAANARRPSAVAKARRSEHARNKDRCKRAEDDLPIHSFRTLLKDLATLALNVTHSTLNPKAKIRITTRPTPVQEKAFSLLGINHACTR